jgi:hypothetical protein
MKLKQKRITLSLSSDKVFSILVRKNKNKKTTKNNMKPKKRRMTLSLISVKVFSILIRKKQQQQKQQKKKNKKTTKLNQKIILTTTYTYPTICLKKNTIIIKIKTPCHHPTKTQKYY